MSASPEKAQPNMDKYIEHIHSLQHDIDRLVPFFSRFSTLAQKSSEGPTPSPKLLDKYAQLIRMRYILSRSWPDLCVPLNLDDHDDTEPDANSFDDILMPLTFTSDKDKFPLQLQSRSLTYDAPDTTESDLLNRPRSFSEAYTQGLYYVLPEKKEGDSSNQKLQLKSQRRRKVAEIGRQRAVTFCVEQEGRGCVQRTPTPYPRDVSVESEPEIQQRSPSTLRDRLRFRKGRMSVVRASKAFNQSQESFLEVPTKTIQRVQSAPSTPLLKRRTSQKSETVPQ